MGSEKAFQIGTKTSMTHLEQRFEFSLKERDKHFLSIWVDFFQYCISYYALGHLFDVIYIHTSATTPALWCMDATPEKFEKTVSLKTSSSVQGVFF